MAVDRSKLVVSYRGLEPLLKTAKQESAAPSVGLEGTPDEKAAFAAGMKRASIELQRAPHNPKVFWATNPAGDQDIV